MKDYINGLFDMASFALGPSYVQCDCLDKDHYLEEFKSKYSIKDDIFFQILDFDFKSFVENTLYLEEPAIDTFVYYLTKKLGNCISISTIEDPGVIETVEQNSTFSFVEDVFFLQFTDTVLLFVIGNNE